MPSVYIFMLLLNWFKLSIPYVGESKYGIYSLFVSVSDLLKYMDADGYKTFFVLLYIILVIMAAFIVLQSIISIKKAWKHDHGCTASFLGASTLAIVTSVYVMAVVFLTKMMIGTEVSSMGFGDIGMMAGNVASDIFGVTSAPIILLVLSIIFRLFARKADGEMWKLERTL